MEKTLAPPPPTAETTKREKNSVKRCTLYSGLAAMEEQGRRGRRQQCLDTLCCFFVCGECAKNLTDAQKNVVPAPARAFL
jgi:hypothetical protein